MQKRTDGEIIYDALLRYQRCCKSKKNVILSQGKITKLREQMMQQVEKYVLFFKSPSTSEVEKRTLCNKGKTLYQNYCFQLKVNPEVDTTRLAKKMDEIIHFISDYEAEKFKQTRERDISGEKIDLEQLLSEEKNVRALVGKPIDKVVHEAFSNQKYTVVGEDNAAVYMTAKGAKYHRKDCAFCKGKTFLQTTLFKAENIGLKPCKCMEKHVPEKEEHAEKDAAMKECIIKCLIVQKKYVTAFVDESVRLNPWRELDESIPEKQGIYSYIICDGILNGESQMTDSNTLYTGVRSTEEVHGPEAIAVEAIMAVLFQLASTGYRDHVLIYTDNMGAKNSWYKSAASKHLAELFAGVTVCYIPREANRKADRLGRKTAVMEIPAETMTRILGRCKGYFDLKKEMDYVKSYFPTPMKNIPNLMLELSALAEVENGGA